LFANRVQGQWLAEQYGGTKQQLSLEEVENAVVYLPSETEQRQQLTMLRRHEQIYRVVAAKLQHQIELLQERRRALITAAVTGQLPIPGVAA
jgi:type I restriction enzyme S subunit